MYKNNLILQLVKKNIIMHGDFYLKSGKKSSIYINLKDLISYPQLMSGLCVELHKKIQNVNEDFVLCGVPIGGIPIATTLSMLSGIPQILLRKQSKLYGMKKLIEGNPHTKNVVVIEDVVTSGSSVIDACTKLQTAGFSITHIFSLVYRGEEKNCTTINNFPFSYLFHIDELREAKITKENIIIYPKYQQLTNYISQKKSNIILAYDKSHHSAKYDLLLLLEKIHPYIAGLKIHNELLHMDMHENLFLYNKCKTLGIFLWEDRKFNDTGNTIENQIKFYENCRDYISIAPTSGSYSLNIDTSLGMFVLCEMSTKDNLFNPLTTQKILSMIDTTHSNICGLIGQSEELFQLPIPTIMPGINLKKRTDNKGQCWRNPNDLLSKPTFYVVGRGITDSIDPQKELIYYLRNIFKKKMLYL